MQKAEDLKAKLAAEAARDGAGALSSSSFLQGSVGLALGHYDPAKEEESIRELERKWQRDAAKLASEDKSLLDEDSNSELNSMIEKQKEKERNAENELDKMKAKLTQDIEAMHKDVSVANAGGLSTTEISSSLIEKDEQDESAEKKKSENEVVDASKDTKEATKVDGTTSSSAVVLPSAEKEKPEEAATSDKSKDKPSTLEIEEVENSTPAAAKEKSEVSDKKDEKTTTDVPVDAKSAVETNKEVPSSEAAGVAAVAPPSSLLQLSESGPIVKAPSVAVDAAAKPLEQAEALLKKMDQVLKTPIPSSSFLQSGEKDPAELALDKAEQDLQKLQDELRQESSSLSASSASSSFGDLQAPSTNSFMDTASGSPSRFGA
jgi:hypothetical protein